MFYKISSFVFCWRKRSQISLEQHNDRLIILGWTILLTYRVSKCQTVVMETLCHGNCYKYDITFIEGTCLVAHLHSTAMVNELLTVAFGYSKLWQLNNNIQFLNIRNHPVHRLGKVRARMFTKPSMGPKRGRERGTQTPD